MSGELEFLSDEWREVFTEVMTEKASARDDLGGIDYTVSEIFTGCPPDGGTKAHWFSIDQGRLTMGEGIPPRADMTVRSTYEAAVRLGAELMRSETLATVASQIQAAGLFAIEETRKRPRAIRRLMADVHDEMVRRRRGRGHDESA